MLSLTNISPFKEAFRLSTKGMVYDNFKHSLHVLFSHKKWERRSNNPLILKWSALEKRAEAANSWKAKGSYKVSTPRNSNTKKDVMKSRSTYLCTKNKIGVKNNHNIPCMISGLEFFSTYTQPIEGAGRFMAWNFGIHFHFTVHQLLSLTAQSRINQSTKTSAFQTFTAAVDPQVSHSKWEKRPGSQVPIPKYMAMNNVLE